MIPWEGLIPYAIIAASITVAGSTMTALRVGGMTSEVHGSQKEKPSEERTYITPRFNIDQWDKHFAIRDIRLTGSFRGEQSDAEAHESFETNSVVFASTTNRPWIVRKHLIMMYSPSKIYRKYCSEQELENLQVKENFLRSMDNK